MTRRNLIGLICSLVSSRLVGGEISAFSKKRDLVWLAEKKGRRIYLLGTIHALRPAKNFKLPSVIEQLYRITEATFLEFSPAEHALNASTALVTKHGLLPAGKKIWDLLDATSSERLRVFSEKRTELPLIDRYRPWLAAMAIQNILAEDAGFNAAYGAESYLTQKSMVDKKPLRLLERMEDGVLALSSLPLEVQKRFLMESLSLCVDDMYARAANNIQGLWLNSQGDDLVKLLSPAKMIAEVYEGIILARNEKWAERLSDTPMPSSCLVCTGCQHLVGRGNLGEYLEKRGFVVRSI